jgi:hypothetical protein
MASAPEARWHGDNYQSRFFWLNALKLARADSCVAEVTFEADGPKAFDDVIVKYDPPIPGPGPNRISADYHQIKWHVTTAGRFGYADLIDPEFIGASAVSLLERLRDAKKLAPSSSLYSFVTTDQVKEGDPLGLIISNNDRSLLLDKLFDGTGDRSRMGQVRKLWKRRLGLLSDEELRQVLEGFRIHFGYSSLERMRQDIEERASSLGLKVNAADSDFRYDELARRLKSRGLNGLTPAAFNKLCDDEGLRVGPVPGDAGFLPIAVRSFLGPSADVYGATSANTLLLTDQFRERYLRDNLDWQSDIGPLVENFLREKLKSSPRLRLILDTHASIAFLAGKTLDLKSAVEVELYQKGQIGPRIWTASDGTRGASFVRAHHKLGEGRDIAVGIGVSRPVDINVRDYAGASLPQVGTMVSFMLPAGVGQQVVAGGFHAAALAEQVANEVRALKVRAPETLVHIFASCPNSLLFFLGQHHQGIGPCIVYEYDFDRRGNRTYQPSFTIY